MVKAKRKPDSLSATLTLAGIVAGVWCWGVVLPLVLAWWFIG